MFASISSLVTSMHLKVKLNTCCGEGFMVLFWAVFCREPDQNLSISTISLLKYHHILLPGIVFKLVLTSL